MSNHHSTVIACFLLLFVSVVLALGQVSAQDRPNAFMNKAIPLKSKAALAFDEQAKAKLEQMPAEEVKALDEKLAKALTLFYEHHYAEALPLLKDAAAHVETMDIKFWLAGCARGAGDLRLAIKKYKEMLAIDPELHRVRLDLAATQYQAGQYQEAKKKPQDCAGRKSSRFSKKKH